MAGVRGKSGRKTRHHEATEGKFGQRMIYWLQDNFDELDLKTRVNVAINFGLKSLPSKVESTTEDKRKSYDDLAKIVREVMTSEQSIIKSAEDLVKCT